MNELTQERNLISASIAISALANRHTARDMNGLTPRESL